MARLSMNELTTYRWSFEEDLHHYRQEGYQGVGVWLRKLHDFGEERALELLEESGLGVSNVMWSGGFTGSDGARAEDNIQACHRALDAAASIGADCLVVYTGGRNTHTARHAGRLLRSALDRLVPHAELVGVPLAIEPMHPCCSQEWTFLTTLESAADLVESYDTPAVRMVYDSYHFPLYGDDQREVLHRLAPLLAVVHLGDHAQPHSLDQDRCPLGEGDTPLAQTVQTLLAAGYDGYFDVELLGAAIEMTDYQQLLSQSRAAFDEMLRPSAVVCD